jgi:hypothetical protein
MVPQNKNGQRVADYNVRKWRGPDRDPDKMRTSVHGIAHAPYPFVSRSDIIRLMFSSLGIHVVGHLSHKGRKFFDTEIPWLLTEQNEGRSLMTESILMSGMKLTTGARSSRAPSFN